MNIDIIGRNYEVSERLKEITAQKLQKLDKYFDAEPKAKVAFKKEANSLTLEVMLDYTGRLVRATATGDNFYDLIDVVLPKLEGQIRKHRTRFDKHQKNASYKEAMTYGAGEERAKELVKTKKFALTPMTVEEAIEELELLGHTFYLFLEAKTHTIQVVYLRNDGDVGLIVPEV
ncbi:MAG: ribosome-associated translation inhibitor RaiA [Clostridia bacterium]|nr:ribosome-associated translation inhibitor RaiA [Clostridia bacterium]